MIARGASNLGVVGGADSGEQGKQGEGVDGDGDGGVGVGSRRAWVRCAQRREHDLQPRWNSTRGLPKLQQPRLGSACWVQARSVSAPAVPPLLPHATSFAGDHGHLHSVQGSSAYNDRQRVAVGNNNVIPVRCLGNQLNF